MAWQTNDRRTYPDGHGSNVNLRCNSILCYAVRWLPSAALFIWDTAAISLKTWYKEKPAQAMAEQ
ncbi:hypothetical protein ACFQZI_00345 [Mucilaginibacter lutimaris]|uniref:Uncharacterized protein n=1 Tax=Mucilaginibacter lutimaris TaxID=931629 RepID=A0ABW2Z978_9SPHI